MLTVTVEEVQGAAGAPSLTLGVGKGLLDLEVVWELAEHTESEDAKGRERRVFQAGGTSPCTDLMVLMVRESMVWGVMMTLREKTRSRSLMVLYTMLNCAVVILL